MKNKLFDNIHKVDISITPHVVTLVGTQPDESEIRVKFSPYQGIKLTTIDCYAVDESDWPGEKNQLVEIANSTWLDELRNSLKEVDSTADFLDESKHFMVITHDAAIEIVAHSWVEIV